MKYTHITLKIISLFYYIKICENTLNINILTIKLNLIIILVLHLFLWHVSIHLYTCSHTHLSNTQTIMYDLHIKRYPNQPYISENIYNISLYLSHILEKYSKPLFYHQISLYMTCMVTTTNYTLWWNHPKSSILKYNFINNRSQIDSNTILLTNFIKTVNDSSYFI